MKRVTAVFVSLLMLLSGCAVERPPENVLRVVIPATGKSDAVLLQADGFTVLNDTAFYETSRDLQMLLKNSGIERIDLLILSHFDKDHIGGAANILRSFEVERVAMPDYYSGSEYWLDMMSVLSECETEQMIITAPADFTFGKLTVHIDAPKQTEYEDENNFSLITEACYGETRLLLTGDALNERLGEYLDELQNGTHFDMIKLPHHGDSFPALQKLIKQISPDYAVITCDKTRSTVDEKTLKTLDKYEVSAFFTDENLVSFVSDGSGLVPS